MSNLKEKIKAAQIDLIKELGIDKLEPAQKEKIIMDIGEIIQERIIIRIVEELPEEKQAEFKSILDKAEENPELIDEFLKENLPGVEDMILEEIGDYKEGALGAMQQATGQEGEVASSENQKDLEGKSEIFEESKKEDEEDSDINSKEDSREEAGVEINSETETKEEQKMETELEQTGPEKFSEELELDKKEDSFGNEESELKLVDDNQPEKNSVDLEIENRSVEIENQGNNFNKEESIEVEAQKNQPELSGIERERVEDEAKILEENKVDNDVIKGEELDLSDELKKMEKTEEESRE